jgi:uncharacterized membrane protein
MNYERSGSSGLLAVVRTNLPTLTDAVLILGFLSVADVVLFERGLSQALRALFGLPLVVFLPGYALLALLFPRQPTDGGSSQSHDRFEDVTQGALDWVERATLSFGLSVALLPVLGVVLSLLRVGWGTSTVLGAVNAVVLVGLLGGVFRRYQVPEAERFTLSVGRRTSSALGTLLGGSKLESALSVLLVGSILVASGALGFALMAPADGETYTTMSLLTTNETGEYVASGYPTNLSTGETGSLVVGVTNEEDARVEYTLVAELQRVRATNGSTTVVSERELDRRDRTLTDRETWYSSHRVSAAESGEYRLVYYLYRDDAPADATTETAYRHTHVWVTVS